MFSEALNQRSVAQTCAPNSRLRKIDEAARPQPRSSTRMPGRKSIAAASHSLSHSGLAAPLTLARTQSGLYFAARGNRLETCGISEIMRILLFHAGLIARLPQFSVNVMMLVQ